MDGGSILECIGTELIGVMSPVSICMFLVVLLVYSLSPPTLSPFSSSATASTPIITAANLVYSETPSDSPIQKFEGALLNAAVFILLIAAVTFILFLLYYYNFTNFLKNYMRFSTFFVLGTMGGSISISIITHFLIPVDSITFFIMLFNFTVLGVISVFGRGVPILVTQSYMVVIGIIVAASFTQLPEWTTWILLVALAIYDLIAVLAPGGPLKILVELAQTREDNLPALVYEARPTTTNNSRGQRGASSLGLLMAGVSDNRSIELQAVPHQSTDNNSSRDSEIRVADENLHDGDGNEADGAGEAAETMPLVPHSRERGRDGQSTGLEETSVVGEGMSPLVEMLGLGDDDVDDSETATQGIKLGLGDFVFYSVLVGRAAMYDLMTVYACYLAIISGLGCTLILLSVCRKALPALPISIALGVIFYFLTRLLMEPFVVGASTKLMMF